MQNNENNNENFRRNLQNNNQQEQPQQNNQELEQIFRMVVEFARREVEDGRPILFAHEMLRRAGGLMELPDMVETDVSDDEGPAVRRLIEGRNRPNQQQR